MSDLFNRIIMEADEDAPDIEEPVEEAPPADEPLDDSGPPDIEGNFDDLTPPDEGGEDDTAFDSDFGSDGGTSEEENQKEIPVDEKIEIILKKKLYNEYLKLIDILNDIEGNFSDNNDAIFAKSAEASELLSRITKLKTNVVDYASLYFMNKPYASSLILYNKLKIYLDIIIDKFGKLMKKASTE